MTRRSDTQMSLIGSLRGRPSRATNEKLSSPEPGRRKKRTAGSATASRIEDASTGAPSSSPLPLGSRASRGQPARVPDLDALLTERTQQPVSSLRVAQGFDRVLATVGPPRRLAITKPGKNEWVRTRADLVLDVTLLNFKAGARDDGYYVIDESIAAELTDAVPGFLAATVNQDGRIGAWPLPWPSTDGPPLPYYETAIRAAQVARGAWVNIQAQSLREGYRITPVQNPKPPAWGDLALPSFSKLVRASDRFIDSLDHPVLRTARGEF